MRMRVPLSFTLGAHVFDWLWVTMTNDDVLYCGTEVELSLPQFMWLLFPKTSRDSSCIIVMTMKWTNNTDNISRLHCYHSASALWSRKVSAQSVCCCQKQGRGETYFRHKTKEIATGGKKKEKTQHYRVTINMATTLWVKHFLSFDKSV